MNRLTQPRRTLSAALTATAFAAALLMLGAATPAAWASTAPAATATVLTVGAGKTQLISETTQLLGLKLGKGATLTTPEGKSLTLTVNGIGLPIAAGTYTGNVVLTVTDDIVVQFTSAGPGTAPELLTHLFRTGVYIDNGSYVPGKSVAAVVQGGSVANTAANNVVIQSRAPNFNGIIVTGDSTYAINRPTISLVGNGGNDFVGFGAAIKSDGNAQLTVRNANVFTKGAIRPAIVGAGNSTLTVKDSTIETRGGTLPAGYSFTVATGKMMEVPWVLGLAGNNRATNLVGNATANYVNSRIKAQAWGALSTDDTTKVRLNVKNSWVEVVESGYGTYSIGDCITTFSGSRLDVADMALIMANGPASGTFTDGTVVNSGRFGVMMHSNSGGTLRVDKQSVFNTQAAVFQMKSSSPNIVVDGAKLNPANGILLQAVVNDDPFGISLGFPSSASNVNASFANTTLKGDIINGNSLAGSVSAAFSNATLTGAISTATTTHALGPNGETVDMDHPELYHLIGEFSHSFAPLASSFGMSVSLDASSRWVVSKTSYLTSLTLASGAVVRAPAGKRVTMTVDGVSTPIVAGQSYSGAITLTVS
ncbi:MAG TPA: hypothetical protein VLA16_11965 [Ideonella sp.]|nr:hypothetical protein [Ideonella sp.]